MLYILEQKVREYQSVRRKGPSAVELYKRIASIQPVSWKLLRSVTRRCEELYAQDPDLFKGKRLSEVRNPLYLVQTEILKRSTNEHLYPPVPDFFIAIFVRF